MIFPFYDSTMIILIPAIILSLYAQFKVSNTFKRFSKIRSAGGYTGAQVARRLLDQNGLFDVQVEMVEGRLTDHYDPRSQVVRLSPEVYQGTSLSALGVAAHETGHAVQHDHSYVPFNLRSTIVPVANLGSNAAPFLILIGLFMGQGGSFLVDLGILAFTAVVVFQIVTLPVEFNASSRAMAFLESGFLTREEVSGARKVLSAAALTYVAAALTAVLTLVRFLLLANAGRRDD
ncbi:MAG TPA: zinc metallopeptidase [Candidatus Deferrimicrobium sp.]|nr:zinc metallopeptidase [Candidatus Deferrimicrobium sp.]